jgi:hypothetical protein
MVRPAPVNPSVPVERFEVCPRINFSSVPKWSFGSAGVLSFSKSMTRLLIGNGGRVPICWSVEGNDILEMYPNSLDDG